MQTGTLILRQQASGKVNEQLSFMIGVKMHAILAGVMCIAVAVRVLALISWNNGVYAEHLVLDEQVYHRWAAALAGEYAGFPITCDFTPLFAWIGGLVYKVTGPAPLALRILNMAFGLAACWLIYLIGKGLGGRTAGILACLVAALYKPFIFFSVVLMKTSLSVFLFSMTFCLLLSAAKKPALPILLGLGISAGLLLNVRANCILMIPVLPAVVILMQQKIGLNPRRPAAVLILYGIGLAAALLPFGMHNYQKTGQFYLTVPGGFNFYMGNNPDNPYPYYRPVPFASASPARQAAEFVIEANRRTGRHLTAGEASRYWIFEAVQQNISRPDRFIENTFYKILALFNRFEAADNYHIGFVSKWAGFFRLPLLEFWMVLPFGMAAMVLTARKNPMAAALIPVSAAYVITLILVFSNVRIRLPMLVVLIPMAAAGIKEMYLQYRQGIKQGRKRYMAAAAFFLVVAFLPIPGSDDLTAHFNSHAVLLHRKGLKAEAVEYWEMSSGMNRPYSAFADLALADHWFSRGDVPEAFRYLEKVPDNSLAAANRHAKEGDFLMRLGKAAEAAEAYEKSLRINSARVRVIRKLMGIYLLSNPEKAVHLKGRLAELDAFYRAGSKTDPRI